MVRGAQAMARPRQTRTRILSSHFVITNIVIMFLFSSLALAVEENASPALLKFKTSLANTEPALSNWNASVSPCSGNRGNWVGVLCFNGYVWGLQLENMNLHGQIDVDVLTPLRFMRTLSFMNNRFQGQMPDWRKLGALKSLYVSNNKFSGQIRDDAFKGMTSLKKVYMENNEFTGPIPSSLESPKLIVLRLENNKFTGQIPSISSDNLKVFNVSNNQLEGQIPNELLKMDPSSFANNKALCGPPLGASCDQPIPPPDLEPDLDSSHNTPPSASSPNDHKISPGKIAIVILSILFALLLILLLVFVCCWRKRHENSQSPDLGRAYSCKEMSAIAVVGVTGTTSRSGGSPPLNPTPPPPGKLSFVRDDRRKFDLQDLMRASAEVLGSGSFGASYKAVLVDGEALVVKRFKQMTNIAKEDFHEHMRRLAMLQHQNVLPLVAYLYRKEEKLLVFDFVVNGSLAAHLHGNHSPDQPGLNWATRLKIVKGVAQGLAYIHHELPSLQIPHGHLKSSNVLLDKDLNPVLMDYTLAPVVNPNQVHQILVAYKSPEYAQHATVCRKTDVWCLGILILETLTGKLLAKYLSQGSGPYGAELADWINSVVKEDRSQVFDQDMVIETESCRTEIEKLLEIGIACCEEDIEKRLDVHEALNLIEQVQEPSS